MNITIGTDMTDNELRDYYEARIAMFGTKAWRDLVEDVEGMIAATNDIQSIQDEKTLHFRRGEISIMRWITSLEYASESAYEQLKDEK